MGRSSWTSAKSQLPSQSKSYLGCLMTCFACRLCSLPLDSLTLWSPATTRNLVLLRTQCAAVRTQSGAMSEPPQKGLVDLLENQRPTCHFHSHSAAFSPFTIEMPVSLWPAAATPLTPQDANRFFLRCRRLFAEEQASATATTFASLCI